MLTSNALQLGWSVCQGAPVESVSFWLTYLLLDMHARIHQSVVTADAKNCVSGKTMCAQHKCADERRQSGTNNQGIRKWLSDIDRVLAKLEFSLPGNALFFGQRQADMKPSAAIDVLSPNVTLHIPNNAVGDGSTQACALAHWFGGKKWFE